MFTEKIFPITLAELNELTTSVAIHVAPDTEIILVANEERICMKDLKTKLTLSWIKRHHHQQPQMALTG